MRELEDRLVDLGSRLDWPDFDVAGDVRSRLVARPQRRIRPAWAVAFVVILASVLAIGTPSGRSVLADALGVVGVRISWFDGPTPDTHVDLALGDPVTLDVAVDEVDRNVLVPSEVGLPDAVYLDGGRVSTVWDPTARLPEVGDSGLGMLHIQFVGDIDTGFLSKQLQSGTNIMAVQVRGNSGYWIEGESHVLSYIDPDGLVQADTTRLAENVLLWSEDGVTHRIESVLSLQEALLIADSLSVAQPRD